MKIEVFVLYLADKDYVEVFWGSFYLTPLKPEENVHYKMVCSKQTIWKISYRHHKTFLAKAVDCVF